MRFILLFLFCSALPAVSCTNLKVLRVVDGDSIVVEVEHQGVALPIAVRLQFVDAPEMRDGDQDNPPGIAARNFVLQHIQKGQRVDLRSAHKTFAADGHGRVLAMVYPAGQKVSIQAALIRAGYSVYWRRFGRLPQAEHQAFIKLETEARHQNSALWQSQPAWMQEKQLESRY